MPTDSMSSSPEQALVHHGSFVRRLAHRLLADSHLADDVAQEAWSRFLAAPPASADPRGWLARVVRNLSTNALRARARRASHEELAARPAAARSGAEEAAEAEVLRVLVEAVLALGPAQRDTLLALYFRGVDAKTLARESGVPEPTVRDRQRRALATLRERLDHSCGGPAVWGLGLARLAGPRPVTLTPLATSPLAAAGLLALGTCGALLWATTSGTDGAPEPELVAAPEPEPSAGRAGLVTAPVPSALTPTLPARSALASAALAAPSDDEDSQAVTSELATLRGRFVASDGRPLAGIAFALEIDGSYRGPGMPVEPPLPAGWTDLQGTSDEQGCFELAFLPVPPHVPSFSSAPEGYVRIGRDLDGLEAGARLDLGDVVLSRSATIEGRVLDAEQQPMTGLAWRVSATAPAELLARGFRLGSPQVKADPLTATFRLGGLAPGLNRLAARCDTSDPMLVELEVAEGAVIPFDLVYRGADPRHRLALQPSVRSFRAIQPELAHMRLVSADGLVRAPVPAAAPASGYRFEGLEPGAYVFECDDPRFDPVRLEGLVPGTVIRPELRGNSGFVLAVREASTGQALELYSVEVELRNVNFFPRAFRAAKGDAPLAGGRIEGCVAGDYTLRIRSGALQAEVAVDALAAGETRFVQAELQPGASLAGRVLDELGQPRAGLELLAVRPAMADDGEASPLTRNGLYSSPAELFRVELAATRTDADGRFELTLARAETVLLRAVDALGTAPLGAAHALAPGAARTGLELVCPRGARLAGRIVPPAGVAPEAMRVLLVQGAAGALEFTTSRELEVASDGRFALDGLRAGNYQAFLRPPRGEHVRSLGSSTHFGGDGWCSSEEGRLWNACALGELELAPGVETAREFSLAAEDWPGTLELDVRVDGAPARAWDVRLRQGEFCDLELGTDAAGHLATTLFAGDWFVELTDPLTGWSQAYPDALPVRASQATRQMLELDRP